MKTFKSKFLAALVMLAFSSTVAMAYVTPGDLNRLRGLAMTLVSATITTLTATTATITTAAITTLTNAGILTENRAPTADSATTNNGIDVNLTSPVDTTGTNTHNAVNVDLTVGNATGGTNTINAFNLGNVTGDAEVNINGLKIGTGSRLGTTNAITIGTGWDKGIDLTNSAAADSAATEMGIDLNLTTPVDTTGTNTHYGLNVDYSIGNATGGTNTATAINIANVTGDAQVNVRGIEIGTGTTLGTSKAITVASGWDFGLDISSPVTIGSTLSVSGAIDISNQVRGDGYSSLSGFFHTQVASTTISATVAQADVTFVSNSADVMTLPEASTALGARYTFVCGTVDDFDINPADGTDAISVVASITGANTTTVLAPSAGDAIRCTDIGSSIVLEAIGNDLWASIGTANGIWTDVN